MSDSLPVELFEYRIKPGDSLSVIITKFYNVGFHSTEYSRRLNQVLALNPHIKNADLIHAGTTLRLASPNIIPTINTELSPSRQIYKDQICKPDFDDAQLLLDFVPKEDEADFWMLSWLAERSNYLTIPGAMVFGAQENLLSPGNVNLIREIDSLYLDYKEGRLSKGQYDYRRKIKLDQFKRNIGSLDKVLFGGKTPHEAIRIARGGGVPATQHITQNANKLAKLAGYGKYGGFVMGAVGAGAACIQIANTDSTQEKNEIFVETVTSTIIGTVSGWAVGLYLVSNPVGWGTILVLAAGTAATSYGAGKTAKFVYTKHGEKIDLVSGVGVNSICQ